MPHSHNSPEYLTETGAEHRKNLGFSGIEVMPALPKKREKAFAYLRTSSATNVDGDSAPRQREAIRAYAARAGFELAGEFYDAAVSGADPVDTRPGFAKMLAAISANGARTILVENASRFARDLAVQLAGHALLRERGIELVPVDAPAFFTDPGPTAEMVRQILGSVSQFQKAALVAQMRGARDKASKEAGRRIEGRKPSLSGDALALARRLRRRNPKSGERRSLRDIAAALAEAGHFGPATKKNPDARKPYSAEAIRQALAGNVLHAALTKREARLLAQPAKDNGEQSPVSPTKAEAA